LNRAAEGLKDGAELEGEKTLATGAPPAVVVMRGDGEAGEP
jgi:hypothetical protein